MTNISPGAVGAVGAADDDQTRRRAAAQIRRQHPGFVVIWAADLGRYRAWPLIRAPRGTVLTARTPDELTAQIQQLERAVHGQRAGSADAATSRSG